MIGIKGLALCFGLITIGAGFVTASRIQPTKDDVEVLVDKLHAIVLPNFQKADGPKGISRIAVPRQHPIYNFGGPSDQEMVSLLTLASLSKDQEIILEGFSSKHLTVRITTMRPIKGVMTVGGVASTKGKTDVPLHRSEFVAFQKAISAGCDQGWARGLSAGKATVTKAQGWTHYYRPIKSNLAECVNCHSPIDGRNLQLGDTIGVVCYSVKRD